MTQTSRIPDGNILEPIRYNSPVTLSTALPGERIITLSEVSNHDEATDCWIVIYDRVYDISDFFDLHPGGYEILLDWAGRDATMAFRGSGHSKHALKMLTDFMIGELPHEERIFRKHGGYNLSDIPK